MQCRRTRPNQEVRFMDNTKEWRFCIVANVKKTHIDENGILRYGSKAFPGGSKVFLSGKNWDPDSDNIAAIGRNRHGRYAIERLPISIIENVRLQRIFRPGVIELMDHEEMMEGWPWWKRTAVDRKEAQAKCEILIAKTTEPKMKERYHFLIETSDGEVLSLGEKELNAYLSQEKQK